MQFFINCLLMKVFRIINKYNYIQMKENAFYIIHSLKNNIRTMTTNEFFAYSNIQ